MEIITSNNFDESFEKLLETKKGEGVVRARFDLEDIDHDEKIDFIIQLISTFELIKGITYKILSWEKDEKIEDFFKQSLSNIKHQKKISYKNREKPGVFFVDDKAFNVSFLKTLLNNHFNFEMAKDPAQNIRVQLCINSDKRAVLDIYDDRGFDVYYII